VGWVQVLSLRGKGSTAAPDQRIFGSREFVEGLFTHAALVIGAEPFVAQAYLQRKLPKGVSGIPWYADAQGEAWRALSIKSAPVLIGIRKGRMEWDDQRPGEGLSRPDLRHPDLGGVLSSHRRAESPRHQVHFPTDRTIPSARPASPA
jgi:hypothetical protein